MGGLCCQIKDEDRAEFKSENIFREVLSSFPKQKYYVLVTDIQKIKVYNDDLESDVYFSEILFQKFRNHYLHSKPTESHIMLFLIPDWNNVWDLIYDKNLPLNLIIWGLLFNADGLDMKYTIFEEMAGMIDKRFDLNFFIEIMRKYLYLATITLNKFYLDGLIKLKTRKEKIYNELITNEIYDEANIINEKISNTTYFDMFFDEIEFTINKIFIKYSEIDLASNKFDSTYTREMFYEFHRECTFIFDPLKLRVIYYSQAYLEIQTFKAKETPTHQTIK